MMGNVASLLLSGEGGGPLLSRCLGSIGNGEWITAANSTIFTEYCTVLGTYSKQYDKVDYCCQQHHLKIVLAQYY